MSIQKELDAIKNAVYGKEVRGAIHDGIKKTYDDASVNGNANMEVALARGVHPTLGGRLEILDKDVLSLDQQLTETDKKVKLLNTGIGETFSTLLALKNKFPNGDEKDHIVAENGHRYFWSGTEWADGGAYQARENDDNSISFSKLKEDVVYGVVDLDKSPIKYNAKRLFVPSWEIGAIDGATGANQNSSLRIRTSGYIIPTETNAEMKLANENYKFYYVKYELDGTFLNSVSWINNQTFLKLEKGYKYRVVLAKKTDVAFTQTEAENIIGTVVFYEGENSLLTTSDKNKFAETFINSPLNYGGKKFPRTEWRNGASWGDGVVSGAIYRIISNDFIEPTENLHIQLNRPDLFRYAILNYQKDGTFISDSGWMSKEKHVISYTSNKKYRIMISKINETTSEKMDIDQTLSHFVFTEGIFSIPDEMLTPHVNDKLKDIGKTNLIGLKKKYVGITCQMGYSPANSLEAIKMSKHAGAFGVEMDVRLTKDNDVVLAHESRASDLVNETAGKMLHEYTMQELKAFDVTSGAYNRYDTPIKLASLDEAIVACKNYGLVPFIDLQYTDYENTNQLVLIDAVIEKVIKHNIPNDVVFISPRTETWIYIREKLPYSTISIKRYIETTTVESDLELASRIGGNIIIQPESTTMENVSPSILTPERISRYHEKGYPVKDVDYIFTFTANNEDRPMTKYWVRAETEDNGLTWTMKFPTPGVEVSVAKSQAEYYYDSLQFNFNNLDWNMLAVLKPKIIATNIKNPKMGVNCFYDEIAKKITATFKKDGVGVVKFDELPQKFEFTLYVEF